ncbi:MAG: LLM class flavin-dependent oxidoreductase [Chloroflexota bacterium]|jgi:5,10-methylenetetrahydromethanopterin reductase|nr:LLM class flavin-dependent oxidoreductase [Chloroflexota bacterium]
MSFLGIRLGNEAQLSAADIESLGVLAEEHGYRELWMTEGSGRDSLTQLTAIAIATTRICLGTGILPMFSRSPLVTAMSSAGLASVSNGRFILGLGVGNRPAVEDGHGLRFEKPMEHLRDLTRIVRGLLQGEKISYQGKAIAVSDVSLGDSAPKDRLPIYIAALGPRMLEMAGEVADGVLLSWTAAHYLKEAIKIVQGGAVKVGRDPSEVAISGYLRVAVTDDIAAGRASLQRQIARYASSTHYQDFFRSTGFQVEMEHAQRGRDHSDNLAMALAIGESMQDEVGVVGSAEVCLARIEELREMGLTKPIIAPVPVGGLKESYERTIKALSPILN